MARAKARYGFLLRTIGIARAGKSSATITADAFVVRAAAAYFGLATKVSWPAPASSIPATPVISISGEPFSRRAPSADTICASLIGVLARTRPIVIDAQAKREKDHEPPRGCEPQKPLAHDPPNRRQQAAGAHPEMEISPHSLKRQTRTKTLTEK